MSRMRMMQPDPPNAAETPSPPWAATVALVVLILVVGAARVSVEAPFFYHPSLVTSAGLAPVPQDDPSTPDLDGALRTAAAALPADSACVIAADSWNRAYFRASYLLMPRDVWPVAPLLGHYPPSLETITAALARRRVSCLLVQSGVPIPRGWGLLSSGVYALYVPVPHS